MKDNLVDLTVTSPPYDNLRDYKGYSFQFEEIAKELYRTTRQGGVVVWVVSDATINGSETGSSFRQALYFMEVGFNLHDTMIWEKSVIPQNSNRYEPNFEYMYVLSKGRPNIFNPIKVRKIYKDKRQLKNGHRNKDGTFSKLKVSKTLFKIKGNIWKINTGGGITTKDKIAYQHPAIFPEKLAYDHIISWSNKNDIVFDPFMGSGTTAKMAEIADRRWIGCEISEEYCKIAKERIEQERAQLKIKFE
jgi:site-specific DNA-methyltransferase (adenine-specific)